MCQVRGDWAFFCECFHFPAWNSDVRMCPYCMASSTIPHLLFSNTRKDAPWKETVRSHEEYLRYLHAEGLAVPVWFACLLGFRLECAMVDVLHTVDQGVASHIVASVIWLVAVVKTSFGGATQAEKISEQ